MRRGNGRIFLPVEVDEIPLVEKLIEAEFLRPEDCDNRVTDPRRRDRASAVGQGTVTRNAAGFLAVLS